MKVNGLELPVALERDLNEGRRPLSGHAIAALTALLTRLERPLPRLYALEGIQDTNRLWDSPNADFYVGAPSDLYRPGDVDRRRTLIIGHAEPDSPIALDYRSNPPRVIYLGDVDSKTYWLELAPSYEVFISMIGGTP